MGEPSVAIGRTPLPERTFNYHRSAQVRLGLSGTSRRHCGRTEASETVNAIATRVEHRVAVPITRHDPASVADRPLARPEPDPGAVDGAGAAARVVVHPGAGAGARAEHDPDLQRSPAAAGQPARLPVRRG